MTAILPVVPKYPWSAMHIGDRRARGAATVGTTLPRLIPDS
jgi:hypothetical protein